MKIHKDKRFFRIIITYLIFISFPGMNAFPEILYKSDTAVFIPDRAAAAASADSNIDDIEFMYYSFRFSGVSEEKAAAYLDKYENLAIEFSRYLKEENIENADSFRKGEALLSYLHDNLLVKYSEMETRIDVLFEKGIFNCVSSGIIYFALAMRSNLDVRGVRTDDHAFCALTIDGETVDVETTTKYGFDPGEKKEFSDSFGQTGFRYTPPSNYRDRRDIDSKQMLSLILQNRISEMQHKGNYTGTVSIAVDRHALLGTEESYRDLMTEFKNHAVLLSNRNEFGNAVSFLASAASAYDYNPVLTDTAGKLFYNQIVIMLDKNQTESAQEFYNYFQSEPVIGLLIKEEVYKILNDRKLYNFVMKKGFSDSNQEILNYREKGLITEKEKNEYIVFIYSREIQRLSSEEGWSAALDASKNAVLETDNDSRIIKLKETVENNIGVIFHNRFVSLYNKGEKEQAAAVLEEGLAVIPGNKTLLSDFEYLKN